MNLLEQLYARSPLALQHSMISAFGLYWRWLRFGGNYRRYVAEYAARDGWTATQWQHWQRGHLREVLRQAAEHVPYYAATWSPAQKRAAHAGELAGVPLLEKDAVRADPFAFVRRDLRRWPRFQFPTSGSSGTPINSIWLADEVRRAWAIREARSLGWAGVAFSLPRATFSGRMIEPNPHSKGPFYRFNLFEKQVYFSAYHLGPETAGAYALALQRHRVRWATGYAVSFYLLAKFLLEQRIALPPLQAVITTSEKLTAAMRAVMQRAYGCRIWEEYSTTENTLFASECEHGRLHASPDIGIVEILRPDGTPCAPGEIGEVVATSLMRVYQPFVRFRLGDLAAWDGAACPCGRALPVLREVVGRVEDVVVGADGRQMVRFHGIFVDQPRVREGQVIQEAIDHIRVRVAPAPDFGDADVREIEARVRQRLGANVQVTVETVERIPRTRAGKFPAVVSLLRRQEGAGTEGSGTG